jgi:hypothetical protein
MKLSLKLSLEDRLSEAGIDKWVAELGCTSAPVPRQNIQAALTFFAREMPHLCIEDAVGFVAAMDLSKSVGEVTLKPGERLIAFRTGFESPYKTFFARRGASAEASGINTAFRAPVHFVVRMLVPALETFTTSVKVIHGRSMPGQRLSVTPRAKKWFDSEFGVTAMGGGRQLIIPESYAHLLVESRSRP